MLTHACSRTSLAREFLPAARRRAAGLSALLTALAGFGLLGCQEAVDYGDSSGLPNFILVLADDQGWSQVSMSMDPDIPEGGSGYLETPNLERLGQSGMRFSNAYAPSPFCTPTRRSILCGTNAARSGPEFQANWRPADHLTIPKALKRVHPDYRTAHFGKWGSFMESTPEESGYDLSDGPTDNHPGGTAKAFGYPGDHFKAPPYFLDEEDGKRSHSLTEKAIAFMREQSAAQKPFYIQLSFYALHLSVVCKSETLLKYEAKGAPDRGYSPAFAAMLEEMDSELGRLLDAVEEAGIGHKTYVLYTSDNGGRATIPGGSDVPPNLPLRGAKHSLLEGGIRVPMLVQGPGIEPGSLCRRPVVGHDLLSTFYDLAGGTRALPDEVDGVSLRALFRDPEARLSARPRDTLIFHRPKLLESAIVAGTDKLLLKWTEVGTIESRAYFDLSQDPFEAVNLLASQAAAVRGLEQELLGFLEAVNSPMPGDYFPRSE